MKKFLLTLLVLVISGGIIYTVLNVMSLKYRPHSIGTFPYDTSYSPGSNDISFSKGEILAIGEKIEEYSTCEYITIKGARITHTGPNAGGCSSDYFYYVRPVPELSQNDPFGIKYNIAMEIKDHNMNSENNFNTLKALLEESSCNKNTLLEFANQKINSTGVESFKVLSCLGEIRVYKKQSTPM